VDILYKIKKKKKKKTGRHTRRRQARPESAERGLHAQIENKDALAREGHASSSRDLHDRNFQHPVRNTAGTSAG